MLEAMGLPNGFGSTSVSLRSPAVYAGFGIWSDCDGANGPDWQGQHVDDDLANISGVRKPKKRMYRQYMNRKGEDCDQSPSFPTFLLIDTI